MTTAWSITRAKPSVSIRTLTDNPAAEGNLLRFEIERSEVAGDVLEVRVGMDELDVIDGQGHGDILPDAIENTSPLREIEPNHITAVFTVETVDDIVWEKHSMIEMKIKPEDWYSIDAAAGTATIVVHDDDFPESEAVLSVSPNPVNEGKGQATATITVTTDYDQMPHGQVSIPITTSDGSAKAGRRLRGVKRQPSLCWTGLLCNSDKWRHFLSSSQKRGHCDSPR